MRAGTRLLPLLLLGMAAPPVRAQGLLDQFTSEGLRLAGIGADVGGTWSDRLDATLSASLRVDAGRLAPGLRSLVSVSWFHSRYADDEIATLEERLAAAVVDPTGDATVEIDSITLTNVTVDLDFQYLFGAARLTPYVGLGGGVHFRDADGEAIEGTIVEDGLQAVVAAVNATAGLEFQLSPALHLTGEVRGILASGLMAVGARAGLMVRLPGRSGS
jgi:hypothetical protein